MILRRVALKIILPGILLWLVGQFFILPHFSQASPTATYVTKFGSHDKTYEMWVKAMAYNPVDQKIYATDINGSHYVTVYNLDGTLNRKYFVNKDNSLGYIDIDPSGNLYISAGSNLVYKYDINDHLVTSWGTNGVGNGQFQGIGAIRYSAFNNKVYVLDNTNRVQIFDANGNYLSSWAPGITSGYLAISPVDGTVYVAAPSTSNPRVKSFDADGNPITSWGTTGTGDGQFGQGVSGISVDAIGKVYVTDFYNSRVEVFQSNGTFINKFGTLGTGVGQFDYPQSLVIVPSGDIYVTDMPSNLNPTDRAKRVEILDSSYAYKSQFTNTITADTGKFEDLESMVVGPDGYFYVADTHNYRIQVLDKDGNYIRSWGSYGAGDGQFDFPGSIAIANNKVYVLDGNNHNVQAFDMNGNFLFKWGSTGTGDGQFAFSEGITADADGNIYVAEENNHRIQAFDANGNFLRKWGTQGSGDGQLNFPTSIMYSPVNNYLYVVDSSNYRIEVFDTQGNFIKVFGSYGTGDGQMDYSENIAVDAVGNIYLTDSSNDRFEVFDKDGNFITKWGTSGIGGNTQFHYPLSIAVDSDYVYVTDYANWEVQSVRKFALDVTALPPVITTSGSVQKSLTAVSGTAEPNATITVSENASTICTTTADGSGNWTCTLSSPISEKGSHTINATQTDISGNSSTAATSTVEIVAQTTRSGSVPNSDGSAFQQNTNPLPTLPTPVVTPITTPEPNTSCSGSYFTQKAHLGSRGTEVSKIQQFLKDKGYFFGRITGFYGFWTNQSVKDFQQAYSKEILVPLNLIKPTGNWSYSTIGLANNLACGR